MVRKFILVMLDSKPLGDKEWVSKAQIVSHI